MTEKGMELVPLSPELAAAIRERATPLQAAFLERVPAAAPIVEQYRQAAGKA
jgi:hypothetical protein